ncbi:hypothetical protein P171DRAFT_477078 [Karstenula rhodostoma CBS 690.94]|uniref:Uncharacterized protein n=1 Tax=Karstenula rhodostoma CBS 690.94 TaxID=1392251 RepID=A0A9P4P743_9PLEO|nr:hypothetical protein P171DRAFT_477078 [Karstenula rhodostoma CBS 690.94]
MPPKHNGQHKPANIIVGRAGQSGQTFNDTSLLPFLRAYTRMNSRDAGGGDRQFNEEFNLARRIVEELNRYRDAPPDFIHDLVYSIANPNPDQQPMYPTLRSQGVSDQTAYQNRIIVSVLLMMHATNDGDGGVTRGGLWLPPRQQARDAQDAAAQRGQAVRYPTWSRDEAEASTPSRNANWTASGRPLMQQPQAGSLRSLRSQGFNSAVGNLPPFSSSFTPTPQSYGRSLAGAVLGPPSAGLGGYHWSSRGPQQYPSNSSLHSEYGVPPPPAVEPRRYVQDTLRSVLPQGNESAPYNTAATSARDLSDHPFWQPSHPPTTQRGQSSGFVPPPPGLEGMDHISAFGSETNSPIRPAQRPIGSDRPHHDSRRHGGSRSSHGDSARGTPSRPAPGSTSRSRDSRSRRDDQGW